MKLIAVLLWTLTLAPLALMAEDFSLSDGREYKGVSVTRVEPDGIVVITQDGVEKLPFTLLPKEVQDAYRSLVQQKNIPSPFTDKGSAVDGGTPAPQLKPQPAQTPASAPAGGVTQATANGSGAGTGVARHETQVSQGAAYLKLGIEAALGLLLLLVAQAMGWFILSSLLTGWACRQRQKEFEFGNVRDFHAAYSDFIAIWKLWNHYLERHDSDLPDDHGDYEFPHAERWELLTRAYMAEGNIESTFLKLASAHNLTPDEIEMLGRFRQGFQLLGEAIRGNKPFAWHDPDHPDYLIFKRLASCIATLISSEDPGSQVLDQRADAFRQITSNRWEQRARGSQDTKIQAKALF
jgi:hypothetical protein